MGKGHRDNHHARKKRGPSAFKKKIERRKKKYIGPWQITFACGLTNYHPNASSDDIRDIALRAHSQVHSDCSIAKFEKLA